MPATRNQIEPPAEVQAFLNVLKLHEQLVGGASDRLKAHDVTITQYNVLRILRGAGPEGLPCLEIQARLINRLPDITRLVDRMVKAGLVTRERQEEDRRVVLVKLTRAGRSILARLDAPVAELHKEQFSAWSRKDLSNFNDLCSRLLVTPSGGALSTSP